MFLFVHFLTRVAPACFYVCLSIFGPIQGKAVIQFSSVQRAHALTAPACLVHQCQTCLPKLARIGRAQIEKTLNCNCVTEICQLTDYCSVGAAEQATIMWDHAQVDPHVQSM